MTRAVLCLQPFYLFWSSGIAAIFALAKQYDTTTGVINNLTSKYVSSLICICHEYSFWWNISWSIFLLGKKTEWVALIRTLTKIWQVLVECLR